MRQVVRDKWFNIITSLPLALQYLKDLTSPKEVFFTKLKGSRFKMLVKIAFLTISLPNVDGFSFNIDHWKGHENRHQIKSIPDLQSPRNRLREKRAGSGLACPKKAKRSGSMQVRLQESARLYRGVIDHDEDDQPRPQPQTIFNEICTAAPSRQGKLLRSLSHE